MIKQLALGILCAIFATSIAVAQQIVPVVWPWSLGDADAQFSRSMMDIVNRQQKNINFVFENRPGAGASVAALHVAANANTILAASSAFFVRPNFFTEGVHTTTVFRPMLLLCSGPLIVTSGKYKTWDDVPKNGQFTVGIGGLGTTSHLVAEMIKARYPSSIIVTYRGTSEILVDAIGQRVDFAVGFISAAEQFIDTGKLYPLGVTGPRTVRNIPSLHSKGFTQADRIVNHHSWLVSKSMPEAQFLQIQSLVRTAAQMPEVQEEFKKLYCDYRGLTGELADRWFDDQVLFWREMAKKANMTSN